MSLARLSLRTFVTAALVAMPALFTASATSPDSPCDALARWADPYRGTSPTLDHLAGFDRAHRRAIVNAVAPAARAALWREHLRRFAQQPELSDTQRALIAEATTLTRPALYAREPAAVQAFEALWPHIDRAFTGEQKHAWFDLGKRTINGSSYRPGGPWSYLVGRFTASAGSVACECSTLWDDCWSGGCYDLPCGWQGSGCGPMGRYVCNGLCQ